MLLTNEEFKNLVKFVYKYSGLQFDLDKKDLVENKLKRRMAETNCLTYKEYFTKLQLDFVGAEVRQFIDLLTINETYFYRNSPQFDVFHSKLIPVLAEEKMRTQDRNIKVWSAGCSNGSEIYTIAILLLEKLPYFDHWKIELLATDISESAIKIARDGLFEERELKDVPYQWRENYFKKGQKFYHLSQRVKSMVKFDFLNLIKPQQYANLRGMDVVFCRNVLIYFDLDTQKEIIKNIYDTMNPGGYIFLGHSESMNRLSKAFKMVRFGDDFVYQKD